MKKAIAKCTVALLLLASPIAAWAFFKPVRVLAPEWVGISCTPQGVCIDEPARLNEAVELRDAAVSFVRSRCGGLSEVPPMVFCSTAECANAFGLGSRAAFTLGTFGIAVAPRGWQAHYLRHEIIHHLQNERLGSLATWLTKPNWFVEGMAYSLSEDPRRPLSPPFESHRAAFEEWLRQVGIGNLWSAARAL